MSHTSSFRRRLIASVASTGALTAAALTLTAGVTHADDNAAIEEIEVIGQYRVDKLSDRKHALSLLDLPQTATVVPDKLLSEQGRRTLRDSMRNITGVSFQAGEGNPPGGGDAFSVRGFSARDDIYVDGVRDPGNYFRDPFYADRIEITKGPASAFAGRGNIGGTVNIVTRAPTMKNHMAAELSGGLNDLFRATGDVNYVLSEDRGIAARLNVMGHTSDEPGRDVVKDERWAVAPAISFGIGGATEVRFNYLHLEQDDRPDFGLPNARNFSLVNSPSAGRVAPVDRSNYYGYSNDYRRVQSDLVTAHITHDFSETISVQSQLRYGRVHNDSIMSAPRFVGNVTTLDATTQAVGNRKPRDQVDEILISQTNLTVSLGPDTFRHTLVGGLEVSDESNTNRRRLDANGPATNLFNPVLQAAPAIAYNGTRAQLDTDTLSFYLFDTVEIGEHFRVVAGIRHDNVKTRVRGFDDNNIAPGFVTDLSARDKEWSGNGALVYKPTPHSSVYVGYGTAFEPSGRSEIVQLAGGNNAAPTNAANFNVAPETSEAWEVGAKWETADRTLSLSGALFQVERTNARTPGVNPGDPAVVLDGAQRTRGVELQAIGALTPEWNVFAGYTYMNGKVTRSNIAFEVGQRLDNAPRHSLTLWTTYAITPEILLGAGVQHVGSRTSNISSSPTGNLTITAPDYTVFDALAEYQFNENIGFRINAYNLTNKYYFQSFASGQSIPSAGRTAVLTMAVKY